MNRRIMNKELQNVEGSNHSNFIIGNCLFDILRFVFRMNRKFSLQSCVSLQLIIIGMANVVSATTQPNILFILVDDMGWADNSLHDSSFYTPHIESLAYGGVKLDYHYVQPQCTPTRVAFLTGRYPGRFCQQATWAGSNQLSIPMDTPTLASLLQEGGYETALFGKWHLASLPQQNPNHFGFDYSYGSLAGGVGAYDHRYRLGRPVTDTWHRNGKLIPGAESAAPYTEGYHVTDLITQEALKFIRKEHTGPWFGYVPYTAVHTPLAEESKWFNDPEGRIARISHTGRRLMAACAYHLDDSIGQLLQVLDETDQRENTLVIFASDNGGIPGGVGGGSFPAPDPTMKAGFSSNQPLRGGKSTAWEGGYRVVAAVNWPGVIEGGRTMSVPMHVVDWLPTLCQLAGIAVESEALQLDGLDVWPQILGQPYAQDRDIYITWGKTWKELAYHRGFWKIRSNNSGKSWSLYNLAQDPYETTNLSAQQPAKKQELIAAFNRENAKDNKGTLVSCWIEAPETIYERIDTKITIRFLESVSDFRIDDITVENASLRQFSGAGGTYTVSVLPTVGAPGIVQVIVNNAAARASGGRLSDRSPVTEMSVIPWPTGTRR